MPSLRLWSYLLAACAVPTTIACEDNATDGIEDCPAGLLAGDLVITEVFANPNGDDNGKEWFEIYNPSSATVDLTGVVVTVSKSDGTSVKSHTLGAVTIAGNSYWVASDIANELKPAHVDYAYEGAFDLRNSAGRIALLCDVITVDEFIYEQSFDSGISRGFDGATTPDYQANDTEAMWCDQTTEFTADSFGTPGEKNNVCNIANASQCADGETMRDIIPPAQGDIVISEIMANPAGSGTDATQEWFEVYVARDVDFNGIGIGRVDMDDIDFTIADADCKRFVAGSHVLFARNGDMTMNDGLVHDFVMPGMNLTGSGDNQGLFLKRGDILIDAVTWDGATDGQSWALDPSKRTSDENDIETNWCTTDAATTYGTSGDNAGTPGAANPSCGAVGSDQCRDPDDDTMRDIVAPLASDVSITEIMGDAMLSGTDTAHEWFEVRFDKDADLNNVRIQDKDDTASTLSSTDCIEVTAGQYVVFAHSADPLSNGGLPSVDVVLPGAGPTFVNSGDTLTIALDDTTLATASYSGSSTPGVSWQIDPTCKTPDTVANYGAEGNRGTPGMINPSCSGSGPQCQDPDTGTMRDIVAPIAADVQISEFMVSPTGTDDTREWIEVHFANAADLNGVTLAQGTGAKTITFSATGDCIEVTAGQYAVFARSADPSMNDGIAANLITELFDFSLTAGANMQNITIRLDANVLDAHDYSGPDIVDGKSRQRTLGSDVFCTTLAPTYGGGPQSGTPGAANIPACP